MTSIANPSHVLSVAIAREDPGVIIDALDEKTLADLCRALILDALLDVQGTSVEVIAMHLRKASGRKV